MRVLAIRGRNIASLADPFEIDLQREPLASASLYAIAGPTGAGKSSLLDAVCLALYDQTPRTAAAPARGGELPEADTSQMSARDSRQLLHRGAAEGYAEVDFVGVDRINYRARWSVRRAHGRRDGRLQKAQLSLHRLPELTPVADVGTKLETLDAIRARVGLDYSQFTRAVLLAQNEFAAFLRADQDERAQLLQTLTGTEQFERLSIAAYQRARHEAQRLERLQEQLQASPLLSGTERAALEQRWEDCRNQRDALREQVAQIQHWQHWQHQQGRLDTELAQAAGALAEARVAQEQSAPRQRELDRMRLLNGLRQPWRRSTDLIAERTALSSALETSRSELEAARERDQSAQQQVDLARQASDQQRAQEAALIPELKQAEQLDEQIGRQTEMITQQRQTLERLQQDLDRQGRQLAADESRQQSLQAALDELVAEMQASEAESWLLRPEPSWREALTQLRRLRKDSQEAVREHLQAQEELSGLLRQHERLDAERQSLAREQASALTAQADCDSRLHQAQFDNLPARLTDVHDRIQSHTARAFDLQRRLDLEAQGQRRAQRADAADQSLALIEGRRPAIKSAVGAAEAARLQAEAALQAAQLAAGHSAVQLRDTLQEGQPCPVCGSREHPYADPQQLLADHSRVDASSQATATNQVRSLQQLLQVLRQQRDQALAGEQSLRDELASLDAQSDATRGDLQRIRAEEAAAQPQLQDLLDALRADPQARELVDMNIADLEAALHAQKSALQAEATALAELERQRSQAEEALRASNQICKALAAQLDALLQRIAEGERALIRARERLANTDAECRLQQLRLQQHCADVDKWLQPLGDQAAEADLDTLEGRLEQRAENRRASEQKRDGLANDLRALERALPHQRGQVEVRSASVSESAEHLSTILDVEQQLQARRALLLRGKTVNEVRSGLEEASGKAEAALAKALDNAQAARVERAQAQTRFEQSEQQRVQVDHALADVRDQMRLHWRDLQPIYAELAGIDPLLATRLFDEPAAADDATLGKARAELARDLAVEQATLDQEQTALAHINEALRMAHQAHTIRLQAVQAHVKDQPTSTRPADIEQLLLSTSAELAQVEEAFSVHAAERIRDDQTRQRVTQLGTAIETQEAISQRWNQLNDLIGSADGKKFRNMAQRRSLHLLLRQGNQQLRQLGSRYSLRPLKEQLNFLLVDQDLGGELRSVHSLSGGESFLVSLALALALAHLSSQQLAIESLFVDEGFGSLDEDTLNTAMQALDRLQAQGRKVGVISHLRELTERIGVQIEVRPQRPGRSRVVVRQN